MSKWTTLEGRTQEFEDLPLQHLSNIFWYHLIVAPNLSIRIKVLNELLRRFPESHDLGRDKVLHYEPILSDEIEWLEQHGHLVDDNGFRKIMKEGKIVGICPNKEYIDLMKAVRIIKQEIGL